MMSCAELLAFAKKMLASLDSSETAAFNSGAGEATTVAELTKIKNRVQQNIDGDQGGYYLQSLYDAELQAKDQGCSDYATISGLRAQGDAAKARIDQARRNTINYINNQISSLNASSSQNNAGTGTPGTAGASTAQPADPTVITDTNAATSADPSPIADPTTLSVGSDPSVATQQFDIGGGVVIDVPSGADSDPAVPTQQFDIGGGITLDVPAGSASGSSVGLQGKITKTQSTATEQDQANFPSKEDWRVRLSLTSEAKYLYAGSNPGILAPLKATNGVIFPYTPAISVNYAANYEATNIVHSNYKIFQYTNSSVDQITIASDFTCQDTFEANYLLAVIHFFRSMTKMFYGQDQNPKAGTPPPLCYMYGMGSYQFAAHPLAITGFSYSLPTDVDYIPTTSAMPAGTPTPPHIKAPLSIFGKRLPSFLQPGGILAPPQFSQPQAGPPSRPQGETTWVPTKIQLSISCIPIISRNTISNRFSLNEYASGRLLNGTRQGPTGGGIW
jgi:hypothetical protein